MASTSGPSGSENPTDNLKKEPSKGILKPSVSYEEKEKQKKIANKSAKWDEMNILKTLHPPDKDYGHMKVDEPKTPYEREINVDDDDEMDGGVNAEELRKRIEEGGRRRSSSFQSEDEPDSEDESPEDKITREIFEKKRKQHYNEFQTAKILAKQMMDEDEDEDENDDNNKQNEASLV